MSEYIPEGALLPDGINVDETAAYFGITDSSKILMEMETVNRHTALTIVLNKISDLLLTDTFDLDSGSNRLQVETGEIYYILTGPLKLLEIVENLHDYLGLNPEVSTVRPNITDEQFKSLESLLDPLNILKIYAIGDVTGGNNELAKYVNAFEEMIKTPAENVENLNQIKKEMTEILKETKNMQMPRPISILSSANVVSTPKIITPQKFIETKIKTSEKKPEVINEINQNEVEVKSKLIEPTVLKSPIPQPEVTKATPLEKPQRLQRPDIIPKKPVPPIIENIPQKPVPPIIENITMEELEKTSLDTNQWVDEEKTLTEVSYSPSKINEIPSNSSNIKPVAPKVKPIDSRVINSPKVKPKVNPIIQKTNISPKSIPNKNEIESSVSSLPKPKQRSPSQPKFNSNGIVRTFPSGNICNGCGVSLNNSWRFCPLCGFNH